MKATETDPVCGMSVDTANARFTVEYRGQTYYFCSTGCRRAFELDPNGHLDPSYEPGM